MAVQAAASKEKKLHVSACTTALHCLCGTAHATLAVVALYLTSVPVPVCTGMPACHRLAMTKYGKEDNI